MLHKHLGFFENIEFYGNTLVAKGSGGCHIRGLWIDSRGKPVKNVVFRENVIKVIARDETVQGSTDTRGILVLAGLRYLRSFVYFSVGFGPIGLLALWKGYGAPGCLLWSVPAGLASAYVVRRVMRFQSHDTDSTLRPEDLIMQKATVLIPLSEGSMGKVRIAVGMGVAEQYIGCWEKFGKNVLKLHYVCP